MGWRSKEEKTAYNKAYYARTKEQRRAGGLEWRKRNKERIRAYNARYAKENRSRLQATHLFREDLKKGLVSLEERSVRVERLASFIEDYLRPDVCRIEGCLVEATDWDAVNPNLPHVPGNLARLCSFHNVAKNNGTPALWRAFIQYVEAYHTKE